MKSTNVYVVERNYGLEKARAELCFLHPHYHSLPDWGSPSGIVRSVLGQITEGAPYILKPTHISFIREGAGGVWSGEIPSKMYGFVITDIALAELKLTGELLDQHQDYLKSRSRIEAGVSEIQEQVALPVGRRWLSIPTPAMAPPAGVAGAGGGGGAEGVPAAQWQYAIDYAVLERRIQNVVVARENGQWADVPEGDDNL